MNSWPVNISGISQGLGVGLVLVPLSPVSCTLLPGPLRPAVSTFYHLLRTVGRSIGITADRAVKPVLIDRREKQTRCPVCALLQIHDRVCKTPDPGTDRNGPVTHRA